MRGLIIALEGVANMGKTTQAPLLREWLRQQGHAVSSYEFPDYQADATGRVMQEMITSGSYQECEPHQYALLAAANMYGRRPAIWADIQDGKTVLVDRYVTSNIVYGVCLGCDKEWVTALQGRMPRADVTVWMDGEPHPPSPCMPEVAMETDRTLQDAVSMAYEQMYRGTCMQDGASSERWLRMERGRSESILETHRRIARALKQYMADKRPLYK